MLNHPTAGRMDMDYVKLAVAEDTQQSLVVFLPADTATAERAVLLSDSTAAAAAAAAQL